MSAVGFGSTYRQRQSYRGALHIRRRVVDRMAAPMSGFTPGETSVTAHGANRMASNSLLECFVYARSAAANILAQLDDVTAPSTLPVWDASQVTDSDEDVIIAHNWDELRRFMWDYVGIVRTNKRLQRAQHRVRLLLDEITISTATIKSVAI